MDDSGISHENADTADECKAKAIQSYAALSIGLICLLVGVPVWWKTTEVYRVPLPYHEISALADLSVLSTVNYEIVTFVKDDIVAELSDLVETHSTASVDDGYKLKCRYIGQVSRGSEQEQHVLETVSSVEEAEIQLLSLRSSSQHGSYRMFIVPDDCVIAASGSAVIGTSRSAFVSFSQDINQTFQLITNILKDILVNENSIRRVVSTAIGHSAMLADKDSMRSLGSSPGYEVTFTLINPQPDVLSVVWDVQSAVDKYLGSLLVALSELTNITVKSQYLHYVGLGIQPRKTKVGSRLDRDQLPHIINPIEAYLGSHVSTNPNINFVVYVPTLDQSPLIIYDDSGQASSTNAFLSPRWGGLLVYNVNVTAEDVAVRQQQTVDMRHVLSVFTSQLRLLLGMHSVVHEAKVKVVDPGRKIVSNWELDEWLRERCVENMFTSASTLHSLAQLLDKISNIVINDDIATQVELAVQSIEHSRQLLGHGQLREAFLISRQAREASESAFFDPSLLELLYFPEDQKFAIYIPLFLPVGIPIILSLISAVQWLRGSKWQQKTKTE